jgi:CBS domain containing-hemolysin-like protein
VARGGIDQVIGFLLLDDVLPIDQEEKDLKKIMRKAPPAVDATTPLESALRQMCEYRVSALMVTDDSNDGKTAGMVTLHDIVRELFKEAL